MQIASRPFVHLRLMSTKEMIKPIIDASSGTTILIMPPDVKQDNHFARSTNGSFIRKFDEFIWIAVELYKTLDDASNSTKAYQI